MVTCGFVSLLALLLQCCSVGKTFETDWKAQASPQLLWTVPVVKTTFPALAWLYMLLSSNSVHSYGSRRVKELLALLLFVLCKAVLCIFVSYKLAAGKKNKTLKTNNWKQLGFGFQNWKVKCKHGALVAHREGWSPDFRGWAILKISQAQSMKGCSPLKHVQKETGS